MWVCVLNSEISPESLDFAMGRIAIAAQLCGNAKVVGCASASANVSAGAENGVSPLTCYPGRLARFESGVSLTTSNHLKEFPYIGLLDSNCPQQQY